MEQDAPTDPTVSERRRRANRWLALALAATLAAFFLLRVFPPEAWAFYPACPFHRWTGLLCPGCGGTRALAALARGDFSGAMRENGLVVVASAGCGGWLLATYARAMRGRHPVWTRVPASAIFAAGASALIFAVARNLT